MITGSIDQGASLFHAALDAFGPGVAALLFVGVVVVIALRQTKGTPANQPSHSPIPGSHEARSLATLATVQQNMRTLTEIRTDTKRIRAVLEGKS